MSVATRQAWSVEDSAQLYDIARWSDDYFHVSDDGTVLVSPDRNPANSIDLKQLVDRLAERGIRLPVLLRFNGILADRLQRLADCFAKAIEDHDYTGRYRCVYPIKVNQQRDVVQQIIHHGQHHGFGVEAGSKTGVDGRGGDDQSRNADRVQWVQGQ